MEKDEIFRDGENHTIYKITVIETFGADLIFSIIRYQEKHNYPSLLFAINLVNIISVEASVREGVHVQAQFLVLQSPEAPALHSPLSHHFSPHQVNLNFLSFSSRRKPWDLCIKIIIQASIFTFSDIKRIKIVSGVLAGLLRVGRNIFYKYTHDP